LSAYQATNYYSYISATYQPCKPIFGCGMGMALNNLRLEGYKRQMDEINRWEKYHKKTHSDRISTENELRAIERRIEQMKKDYSYEKLNYDFIELNLVEIQNRINIIKNDLGIK